MASTPPLDPQKFPSQIQVLNKQGKFYSKQHEWKQAEQCFLESLNILKVRDEPHEQVTALVGLANVKTQSGRYEEAEKDLQEALSIAEQKIPDHILLKGKIYFGFGVNHAICGKIEEGMIHFDQAIRIFKESPLAQENLLEALFQKTEILMRTNQDLKAHESLSQIFEFLSDQNFSSENLLKQDFLFHMIRALTLKGQLLFNEEKLEEGFKFYVEAYLIYNQNAGLLTLDERSVAALDCIAQAYLETGRYTEVVEIFNLLIERVENRSDDDPRLINLLNNLANAYYRQSEQMQYSQLSLDYIKKAYEYYLRASDLCKKLPTFNPPMTIKLITNTAMCLSKLEEWDKAKYLMEQAWQMAHTYGFDHEREYYAVVGNYSDILMHQGDFHGAVPYLEQHLKITEKMFGTSSPKTFSVHFQLGKVHFELGHWQKALEHDRLTLNYFLTEKTFDQLTVVIYRLTQSCKNLRLAKLYIEYSLLLIDAYSTFSKPKDANYFSCLIHLSEVYAEIGHSNEAEELCLKALNELEESSTNSATELTNIYLQFAEVNRVRNSIPTLKIAADCYQKVLFLFSDNPLFDQERVKVLNNLALCLTGLGDFKKAIINYEKARKLISKTNPLSHELVSLLCNMAQCYLQDKNISRAKEYLQLAEYQYQQFISQGLSIPAMDQAFLLNCKGKVELEEGHFDSALKCFEVVFNLTKNSFSPHAASILKNMGMAYLKKGENLQANLKFSNAMRELEKLGLGQSQLAKELEVLIHKTQ